MDEALDEIGGWIARDERHYVCVTGVHGVMESQRDPEVKRIHNDAGLTLADGAPMLWAGHYAGAREMGRVRGPDLLPAVCGRAAERGWPCFFYGGAAGTPAIVAARMQESFPDLQVAGTMSPPFRQLTDAENADIIATINATGARIVLVCLSTPRQERWMAANVGRLEAPVLIGVGAAFDVHAGIIEQAPRWMHPLGLEWLFRLSQDPRRLWRRYLRNNPAFVARVVRQRPFVRPPLTPTRPARADGAPAADARPSRFVPSRSPSPSDQAQARG
jgi:N-acetylglucosaminyldiphosphoundecaprenol N-acetyl-beta-D-mannosaminyltransferase